jgi:hypothetical protein
MATDRDERIGRIRRDGAAALLALLAAGGLAVSHFRQGGRLHRDYGMDPGPALVPELLLVILALLGGMLLVRVLARSFSEGIQPFGIGSAARLEGYIYPVGLLASLVMYMVVLYRTGFIAASAVLAVVWSILLAMQAGRRLSVPALLSLSAQGVAITAMVYLVFRYLLRVPLP